MYLSADFKINNKSNYIEYSKPIKKKQPSTLFAVFSANKVLGKLQCYFSYFPDFKPDGEIASNNKQHPPMLIMVPAKKIVTE